MPWTARVPYHQHAYFRDTCKYLELPIAERIALQCLSLPILPEMTDAEVEYVATTTGRLLTWRRQSHKRRISTPPDTVLCKMGSCRRGCRSRVRRNALRVVPGLGETENWFMKKASETGYNERFFTKEILGKLHSA